MAPATDFIVPPWQYPLGVTSTLLEPPTDEPLTLTEAKLRAGLDWTAGDPRDGLMTAMIAAARAKVEADTSLALLTQTRRITISVDAGAVIPIPAQAMPCQSITPEDAPSARAVIHWLRTGAWSFPAAVTGSWIVVSGWPSPAALLAEAPLLVHAVGLLVAHLATLGRDLASIDEPYLNPLGYEDAIAPFRQMWIP